MKIVIAPDSFKENLTSARGGERRARGGFKRVWPDATYVKVPMADGGEGTVDSLVAATGGTLVTREVTGPMGERSRPLTVCWVTARRLSSSGGRLGPAAGAARRA